MIWGNDLIGQVNLTPTSLNRYYYLKDHLGSIRATVDGTGTVTSYDEYYPFGMVMDGRSYVSGGVDTRLKFTGKERDNAETGYDYFGARYYDSRIARWLQVDPFTEKYMDLSPYNYVGNNPIKNIDPDGKELWDAVLGGINAAIGAVSPSLATPPSEYYNGDRSDYRSGYTAVAAANIIMGAKVTATATPGAVAGALGLALGVETGGASVAVVGTAAAVAVAGATVVGNSTALLVQDATHMLNEKSTSTDTQKQSKVEKSKTTEPVGDKYTKTTEVRPGKGPGQSRAEYVRYKNSKGEIIKTYKDSYDRANKWQGRKPLRGGPEGRPQNE